MFEEYLSLSRPQAIRFVEQLCNDYRMILTRVFRLTLELEKASKETRDLRIELSEAQTVIEQNQQLIKAQGLALSRAKFY